MIKVIKNLYWGYDLKTYSLNFLEGMGQAFILLYYKLYNITSISLNFKKKNKLRAGSHFLHEF